MLRDYRGVDAAVLLVVPLMRTTADIDREIIAVSHRRDKAERTLDYEEFAAQDMLLDQLLDERHASFLAAEQERKQRA